MLTFIYSTVNAGKSANLLMKAHSCLERKLNALIFVPEITQARDGVSQVVSRAGFIKKAFSLKTDSNIMESVIKENIKKPCDVIFVDEAQFLTKQQVLELCLIVDELEIPVFAYGLRTDFKGMPFEGSMYLLCWADTIEEISTFASSGKKATFNSKIDSNGEQILSGESVSIGFDYLPSTRKDFNLKYFA